MAGKHRIFGLGTGGVNLVKSPLELDDNEVVQAQNAEPFKERGVAGLRKRQGLQRVVPNGSVTPTPAGGPPGFFPVDPPDGGGDDPPVTILGPRGPQPNWDPHGRPLPDYTPNTLYNLNTGNGYSATLTPLLPAVQIGNTWYFGGTATGQLLAWTHSKDPTKGNAFFGDIRLREEARLTSSGVADDTYPLPGTYQKFGNIQLVVSTGGGRVVLYDPASRAMRRLPTLSTAPTGSATLHGRLWVVAGLSLYSIDPEVDSAWVTAATVSDAGIAALTGLAAMGGSLYAGSRTGSTQPVRVYKFVPNVDTGAATASTSASVNQTGSPSYMFGPFPVLSGKRMSVIYFGNAGVFDTLVGSSGDAETMTGVSWRILTFDGTLWHNGVDTSSDNIINTWWNGSSNRNPGPIMTAYGQEQFFYTHYQDGGDKLALALYTVTTTTWSGQPGTAVFPAPTTDFAFPLMT